MTTRIFDKTGIIEYINQNDKKEYYVMCLISVRSGTQTVKVKVDAMQLQTIVYTVMIQQDEIIKVKNDGNKIIVGCLIERK